MSSSSDSMLPIAKTIYTLGELMVKDDISDLGYTTYRNRRNHYYHGKHSPNHPSPFHHWQVGTMFMVLGQLMGIASVAREAQAAQAEAEELFGDNKEVDIL